MKNTEENRFNITTQEAEEKFVDLRKGGMWNRNRPLKPKIVRKMMMMMMMMCLIIQCSGKMCIRDSYYLVHFEWYNAIRIGALIRISIIHRFVCFAMSLHVQETQYVGTVMR